MTDTTCALICREESLLDLGDEALDCQLSPRLGRECGLFRDTPSPPDAPASTCTSHEVSVELIRLRSKEMGHMPQLTSKGWMITAQDRTGTIHCIFKIAEACRLGFTTRMLAVNTFDRYVASLPYSCRDKPILLAMACIQLAGKMEENNFQTYYIAHILRCFHKKLDFKDLARLEGVVLKALDWKLSGPTVAALLEAMIHLIGPQLQALQGLCLANFQSFTQQMCSASMPDASFASLRPSHIALAVLRTALNELGLDGCTIRAFVQPIELNFSEHELNTVYSVQNYLRLKMQNPDQVPQKPALKQQCCNEPESVEGSPLKRHRSERMSPTSVLHMEASPVSGVGSASPLSCSETSQSLLADEDPCA